MGEGGNLRFGLGPVERELQPEIWREAGGEAGIAFWGVTVGGKSSHTPARTHGVRLVLTLAGDIVTTSAVAKKSGQEVPWTRGE
jgi:hypothetical protein